MKEDIEFVCSGNNDRSPVAMATGMKTVQQYGLDKQIKIRSSGVIADLSRVPNWADKMAPFIHRAVEMGGITPDYIERFTQDPRAVADELLSKYAKWRNQYILQNLGMDFSDHRRTHTAYRTNAHLVLPVDESVMERVQHIYKGRPCVKVALLSEFAGMPEYDLSGKDERVVTYEDYKKFMDKVRTVATVAVSRVIEEASH